MAHGLGIAILPEMTVDPKLNPDLRTIRSPILFPPSITSVMVNRRRAISSHTIDFLKAFCPNVALPAALALASPALAQHDLQGDLQGEQGARASQRAFVPNHTASRHRRLMEQESRPCQSDLHPIRAEPRGWP
ncbi:MAG: hypothetical protein NVS3B27_13320 [Novosphingobium sp.]